MYLVCRRKSRHPNNRPTNRVDYGTCEEIIEILEIIEDTDTECKYNLENNLMHVHQPSIETDVSISYNVLNTESTNYFEAEKKTLYYECMQNSNDMNIDRSVTYHFTNAEIVEKYYVGELEHASQDNIRKTNNKREIDVLNNNNVLSMQSINYSTSETDILNNECMQNLNDMNIDESVSTK